jgi:ABC-type polysaccharide/polyol phosphate transport system ATPase subunit
MSIAAPPQSAPNTSTPASPSAVSIRSVNKSFRLPHQRYHTLKERALHPFRSRSYDVLRAVDDVSVTIHEGEFFGIVGRNGSGKSTLLKCIAGIYGIDAGEITVRGRLSPFIELGVGFNMELTARDNVIINAIMLGLTPKEARERFDRIIAFAELEEFLDLKLKNYSSGMSVRLAFSVAIQVEAEILLIDEVLAVGDAAFQQKCFDEFHRLKAAGRTILFVTHDMGAIERYCDRAVLLEKGKTVMIGEPAAVARRYNAINFGNFVHQQTKEESRVSNASPAPVVILDGWFENRDGDRIAALDHNQPCRACMEVRFNEAISDPIFGFTLRNEVGSTVFATTTDEGHGQTGQFLSGQTAVAKLTFENWLTPSRYGLTPSVARRGTGAQALDLREDIASIVIHGGPFTGGIVSLPHSFEIINR